MRDADKCVLWGRAAGRCEFAGCNRPLWKSPTTSEPVNIAQVAHIYSFSQAGPRGNKGVPRHRLNATDNLMLVCHPCHRKIDQHKDGGRYTVDVLRQAKTAHEARIERVTGIDSAKTSHVILYGAPVGDFAKPLTFDAAATALFPERYPADDHGMSLQMLNGCWRDADEAFWRTEAEHLRRQFNQHLKPRLDDGSFHHLSLFGFAPQPLLVMFGSLLSDIPAAESFQLRREPPGWSWADRAKPIEFIVRTPARRRGRPALVLSLSATITPDRVRAVLGKDAPIWEVTIKKPHNDFLQARQHLVAFKLIMRPLLDQIKAAHGQTTPLHIFPAMPVSAAIDLGRVRMPKADMPWHIYDQHNARAGFAHALSILTEQRA